MKDAHISLLTLAIMIIGLAIMIGGSGLLGVLFAPLVRVARKIMGAIIMALVCAWLLLSVLSRLREYDKNSSGQPEGANGGGDVTATDAAGQ